ncbi:hypothetical protein HPB47_004743, partial [Ixodes persulcatus]
MGDSDEEYDRRRGRDKFRRERSDYQERRDDRSRGRDDWPEREDRGVYGGFEGGGFPVGGHHPGAGGPWGGGPPQDMGGMVHMAAAQHAGGYAHNMAAGGPQREPEGGMTQPPMMTFKQFLGSQDDGIDDQEAVRKYNEYKMDFRRQQLNEFFVNHKEEECSTIFMSFLGRDVPMQFLAPVSAGEMQEQPAVVSLCFLVVAVTVVILLEGGTEYDLQALDEPYQEEKPVETQQFPAVSGPKEEKGTTENAEVKEEPTQPSEASDTLPSPDHSEGTREDESQAKKEDEDSKSERKSRSRSYSSSDQSSSDSDSDDSRSEDDQDSGVPGEESGGETKKRTKKMKKTKTKVRPASPERKEVKEEKAKKEEDRSEDGEGSSKAEDEEEARPDSTEAKEKVEGEEEEDKEAKVDKKEGKGEEGEEKKGEDSKGRPRPLHRTCSIFLRNLAPTITKLEVEAMCKRYPGFLRVAIADPQAERRFFRRGWVTFERTVNIKEICWNLNNIRTSTDDLRLPSRSPASSGAVPVTPLSNRKVDAASSASTSEQGLTPPAPPGTSAPKGRGVPPRTSAPQRKPGEPPKQSTSKGQLPAATDEPMDISGPKSEEDAPPSGSEPSLSLRDCELGAIVNRDLSRRIRSVNGIASHKQVVRSDIKLAARIVHNLDEQRGLWSPGDAEAGQGKGAGKDQQSTADSFGVSSKNPLLKNITDYLIEEASAEEEELLGGPADREEGAEAEDSTATGGTNLEKDDALIK